MYIIFTFELTLSLKYTPLVPSQKSHEYILNQEILIKGNDKYILIFPNVVVVVLIYTPTSVVELDLFYLIATIRLNQSLYFMLSAYLSICLTAGAVSGFLPGGGRDIYKGW